jgi:hypothetical protein
MNRSPVEAGKFPDCVVNSCTGQFDIQGQLQLAPDNPRPLAANGFASAPG